MTWLSTDKLQWLKLRMEVLLLLLLVGLVFFHVAKGDYRRAMETAGNK